MAVDKINWLGVRKDGVTFSQCLFAAIDNRELLREFDRLKGTNLSLKGSGIELAIDQATGRFNADLALFCEFVWDCVFLRLEPEKSAVLSEQSDKKGE